MPYGKLETLQDCQDFVEGCLFMGTGGGGRVEWGMSMLREALADGVSLDGSMWKIFPMMCGRLPLMAWAPSRPFPRKRSPKWNRWDWWKNMAIVRWKKRSKNWKNS